MEIEFTGIRRRMNTHKEGLVESYSRVIQSGRLVSSTVDVDSEVSKLSNSIKEMLGEESIFVIPCSSGTMALQSLIAA